MTWFWVGYFTVLALNLGYLNLAERRRSRKAFEAWMDEQHDDKEIPWGTLLRRS